MTETECFRVVGRFEVDEKEEKFFVLVDPSSLIQDIEKHISKVIPNLPSKFKENVNLYVDDVYLPKYESARIIKKKDILTVRNKSPFVRKRKAEESKVDEIKVDVDVSIEEFQLAEVPKRKRKRTRKKKEVSLENLEVADPIENGKHGLEALFDNVAHRKVFRRTMQQNGINGSPRMDIDDVKPARSHVRFDENNQEDTSDENDKTDNTSEENNPTSDAPLNGHQLLIKNINIEDCSVIVNNDYKTNNIIMFQVMKLDETYCPVISDFILGKIISVDSPGNSMVVKIYEGAKHLEAPQGKFSMEDDNDEEAGEDKIINFCDIKYSYLVSSS